jgi:hypothetical protein
MPDGPDGQGQSSLTINQNVVVWAQGQLGKQVGNGSCYDLPDKALKAVGGKSADAFTSAKDYGNADYKWSASTVEAKDAQPGDIIQFRDFKSSVRTTRADGSWQEWSQQRPHHSAIILENRGNGRLVVLEQHVTPPGQKKKSLKVVRTEINVLDGVEIRDPLDASSSKVSASGKIWIYRPSN